MHQAGREVVVVRRRHRVEQPVHVVQLRLVRLVRAHVLRLVQVPLVLLAGVGTGRPPTGISTSPPNAALSAGPRPGAARRPAPSRLRRLAGTFTLNARTRRPAALRILLAPTLELEAGPAVEDRAADWSGFCPSAVSATCAASQ